ncbi:HlyD family efflux transporter periplasmic adaptor subunit [Mucilaginibacter sp. Bleaf8]|uniref:HlyD family secretion protein n=1 Tax=Mucilaginibacter sp. Bleaf8 TaxID=2834430 RepID=UPI001BCBCDC2|nr:HlyD family efflux transporter periplasmic adaptor subunit [Mucilaginibacter sp. Bleaf8]MBS7566945.1 HlyD family efflux transporter periplasmic adaptor subunit [Mucilaginibacter sp. Bleaf8]
MPSGSFNNQIEGRHSDEVQDIVSEVPSWGLRWGTFIFLLILITVLGLSAFIQYPDIVKTQLKITSLETPKSVVSKINGKLVELKVTDNDYVTAEQPLAYMESTAKHDKVLNLLMHLKRMQKQLSENQPIDNHPFSNNSTYELGELQSSYQAFAQEYLVYKSSIEDGALWRRRNYLQKDISALTEQERQLNLEKALLQRDLSLAEDEYVMHKKLAEQKAETPAELRQQESKYLLRKSPVIQNDAQLITARTNKQGKFKEIMELDHQIRDEKLQFSQALNSLISQAEEWKNKYVLTAPQNGRVAFSGIIQKNQVVRTGEELFYVNAGGDKFFGQMNIPQENLGKVKQGQLVLIKLKSYPFEEYGMLKGNISHISDVPYHDSVFFSRVNIVSRSQLKSQKPIHLKQGMIANAEIITQDASILKRITRDLMKVISRN